MDKIKIDLGCGKNKKAGCLGIDFKKHPEVDIVLDLNEDKLPFPDESVDYAHARNCLEHLTAKGYEHILKEVYRVLKPCGLFEIIVPYWRNWYAVQPLHQLFFSFNSFDDLVGQGTSPSLQDEHLFSLKHRTLIWRGCDFFGLMPKLAKRNYCVYERWFSPFFPARRIRFLLEKKGD